jgi:uncharacterized protein YjdB
MTNRRKHLSLTSLAMSLGVAAALLAAACSDGTGPSATVPVARVEVIAPAPTMTVGETLNLRAEPRDAQGALLRDRTVTWTSSDEAVATVGAAGAVLARSVGTVVITARAEGRSGSTTLSVGTVPDAGAPSPLALSILPDGEITLDGNETEALYAVLRAGDHTVASFPSTPNGRSITWTSSDSSIVRIAPDGAITTGWAGTATIAAVSEGARAELVVHVRSVVQSVVVESFPTGVWLEVGETSQLTAHASPATLAPTPRPVTWSSSSERVATVDASGKVTARRPGTAVISATVEGVTGRKQVFVQGEVVRALEEVEGSGLPTLSYRYFVTSASGERREYVATITGGSLRTSSGRYVLRLTLQLWVGQEQGPVFATVEHIDEGQISYHWQTGQPIWESDTQPGQSLNPVYEIDEHGLQTGRISVAPRVPGLVRRVGHTALPLVFGAP